MVDQSVVVPSEESQEPVVVVLATKTVEKIQHLNMAAREQGFPIHFVGLNELRDAFRSAPEDTGDSEANALQKNEYTEHAFSDCRREGAYREALKRMLEGMGVAFEPTRILFASEDSTLHLPEEIWTGKVNGSASRVKGLKEHLRPYVKTDLLDRAEGNGGSYAGFGAETGPLLAAVGIPRMMNLIYAVGQDCGYEDKPVYMTDRVDFVYRSLADTETSPLRHLKIETGLCLTAQGLAYGNSLKGEQDIILTTHYLSHAYDRDGLPAASDPEKYREFLGHKSPRAGTVRAIAKAFDLKPQKPDCSCEAPKFDRPIPHLLKMEVEQVRPDMPSVGSAGENIYDRLYSYLDISPRLKAADAFVFMPFDANNLALTRRTYYELAATMVAKMTEAEMMNKPLLILDNGCYAGFRKMEVLLSNCGMMKNFKNHPFFSPVAGKPVMPTGIAHIPTAYADYIVADKGRSFERAMQEVLTFRDKGYRRYCSPGDLAGAVEYVPAMEKILLPGYGVGTYMSAGNDNRILLNRLYGLGRFVVENGHASVSGGGDDHAMGAYYWGSASVDGAAISIHSTPSIVKSETKNGRLAEALHWSLCPDTSARRVKFMEAAASHIVSWGGIGTFEEQTSLATVFDAFPEMRHQLMIVDAKSIYRDTTTTNPLAYPAIEILFGKMAADATRRDHDALKDSNRIIVATQPEEIQKHILEHARGYDKKPRARAWRAPQMA